MTTSQRDTTPGSEALEQFQPIDIDSWDQVWSLMRAPFHNQPAGIWWITGPADSGRTELASFVGLVRYGHQPIHVTAHSDLARVAATEAPIVVVEHTTVITADDIEVLAAHPATMWIISSPYANPHRHEAITSIELLPNPTFDSGAFRRYAASAAPAVRDEIISEIVAADTTPDAYYPFGAAA